MKRIREMINYKRNGLIIIFAAVLFLFHFNIYAANYDLEDNGVLYKMTSSLQLALTVDAPTNVTVTSVTITADVIGDVSKVSKIGVCLGKADETVNPNDPSATNKSESDFNQNNSHVIFNINDLQGNTAYKAVLYLLLTDGTMILGEPNPVQFTTLSKFPVPTIAVDLGLSVEWAPWNVGESSEWGNTHLYGWGDADGENYSTDGNLYAVGLYTGATSICGNDKYDIAAKQWGNGWRMPTFAEIKELYTSSAITITKEIVNGDIGYRFTNNQTNASILLPACGARYGNNVMQSSDFYYWTGEGSYNSVDGWKARVARPLSNTIESQQYPKFWGMAVRPVRTKNGSGGSNPGGGSSDSQATAVAGNYVNLGLSDGTLWADRNVGASRETDYGDYFAWAETEPRTTNFDAAHYKYYNSSTNTYEKTGTDAYDINGEWLICGNENYDAAAKLWKGSWRMPTDYQITCLVNECNWEWKTNYRSSGHNGYLVTGPNGNSIFLPAAGFMSGDSFSLDGEDAFYWSGALNTQQTSFMRAFAIYFSPTSHARVFTSRVGGRSIRPVIGDHYITYSLSITSSDGGSVTYSGNSIDNKTIIYSVNKGTSHMLTFTPNGGYRLKNVVVNGADVTASVVNNQYTITNVSQNTTVSVTFEVIPPTTYALSVKATGNGSATYNGTSLRNKTSTFTVEEGTSATITFTPDNNNRIKSVKVNGIDVTSTISNSSYTINGIGSDTSVDVVFEAIPSFSLIITASGNGSASYNGSTIRNNTISFTVLEGTSATVVFTPDNNYRIADVKVNGQDVTASVVNNQYTITNVNQNTTVNVTFERVFMDGDTFTAKTTEGVDMTFKIISAAEKTCQVGDGASPAIENDTYGSITIPNTIRGYLVTTIGVAALDSCYSLTSATIPNSVTSICNYAFAGCCALLSLDVPNSVVSIGNNAFWGCDVLSSIVVRNGNPVFDSRDDCNAIIRTKDNTLLVGCKNTVIPNTVKSIAFGAFGGCSGLTTIVIPKNVVAIGTGAFEECDGLNSIVVEDGNTSYDSRNNCNAIIRKSDNSLIAGCKNTVIPNTVTSIGYGAFDGCVDLLSILIPNSITSINNYAFSRCI